MRSDVVCSSGRAGENAEGGIGCVPGGGEAAVIRDYGS